MVIATVIGARPQFIKAAVVSRAIAAHNKIVGYDQIKEIIIHTGQHYDLSMNDIFFQELNIPAPAVNLGVGSGLHGETTGRMMTGIESELLNIRPHWVMVYGDTNSTLAGALAAAKIHMPVAHVEAGLRSYNKQMPEELNRVLTDHISDLLLCPTETAVSNLAKEGVTEGVHQVGDVMYDAALLFGGSAEKSSTILKRLNLVPEKYVLATVHRAENTDDDFRLANIMEGLTEIGKQYFPVVLPLHPRTRKALSRIGLSCRKGNQQNAVHFIDPVSFLDMMMLIKNSMIVLTDSGGLQKEAFFHEIPCITMRDETEWSETLQSGWNQLSGSDTKEICLAVDRAKKGKRVKCFGDGNAGAKIIQHLLANHSE